MCGHKQDHQLAQQNDWLVSVETGALVRPRIVSTYQHSFKN